MPTTPHKARLLLRNSKAKVKIRTPFTIQLLYATGEAKQNITLGIDAGSKYVGLSATTEKQELYASETILRNDIVELLAGRKALRSSRRNRKTRYRKPRFNNRVKSKKKGWLAPSIQHKINSHLRLVRDIHKILPITNIVVEVAAFDIQKIKIPAIKGIDYQQGEQLGFWNVREYVLFRDGHICQHCKGKSKDKILNVHHIESRKTGGDTPNNLVSLCETCHDKYHRGLIELKAKRGISYRDAAFMGIMRWSFYNKLKELYNNVSLTYGYITKNTRIRNNIAKTHAADAYCITGNIQAKRVETIYYQKFVRRHNRQIHKCTILKGGKRKKNQSAKYVYGYRLYDKVKYADKECYIFGRRASGYFDLRMLDGTKVHASASYKKLALIERSKSLLTERKVIGIPPLA